ncbi:Mitochondrial glycoprotein family protein [Gossypium australe]|uniref:Mitochondrial glycoprotein family protein n=1 Tax=Gossypium australe TaxID=47621 RepID=A0A5B6VTI4_9ROSI|nr:Mitochondrial glycoprotein family protein [Gossypium australe]
MLVKFVKPPILFTLILKSQISSYFHENTLSVATGTTSTCLAPLSVDSRLYSGGQSVSVLSVAGTHHRFVVPLVLPSKHYLHFGQGAASPVVAFSSPAFNRFLPAVPLINLIQFRSFKFKGLEFVTNKVPTVKIEVARFIRTAQTAFVSAASKTLTNGSQSRIASASSLLQFNPQTHKSPFTANIIRILSNEIEYQHDYAPPHQTGEDSSGENVDISKGEGHPGMEFLCSAWARVYDEEG